MYLDTVSWQKRLVVVYAILQAVLAVVLALVRTITDSSFVVVIHHGLILSQSRLPPGLQRLANRALFFQARTPRSSLRFVLPCVHPL